MGLRSVLSFSLGMSLTLYLDHIGFVWCYISVANYRTRVILAWDSARTGLQLKLIVGTNIYFQDIESSETVLSSNCISC